MSDTPRTDAAAIRCACSTYVVPTEFAQQLERELKEKWEALFEIGKNISQLESDLRVLRDALKAAQARVAELEAQLEPVRRVRGKANAE